MAGIDAFSAQIVEMVRKMPPEAILALVRNQLGTVGAKASSVESADVVAPPRPARPEQRRVARRGAPVRRATPVRAAARPAASAAPAAAPAPAAPAAAPAKAPAKAAPKASTKKPPVRAAGSVDRHALLGVVERVVKAGNGVSASEVAKQANVPQNRAAAALKELKLAKRIFQGGDRRFARYAGDAKTAEQASVTARMTASGPVRSTKRK